ncbi:conserved hypothetical protein [delta proteobacterium NaphS2]|nr:conserved hypothetical protein [delta proteobacterium NaphS2]
MFRYVQRGHAGLDPESKPSLSYKIFVEPQYSVLDDGLGGAGMADLLRVQYAVSELNP